MTAALPSSPAKSADSNSDRRTTSAAASGAVRGGGRAATPGGSAASPEAVRSSSTLCAGRTNAKLEGTPLDPGGAADDAPSRAAAPNGCAEKSSSTSIRYTLTRTRDSDVASSTNSLVSGRPASAGTALLPPTAAAAAVAASASLSDSAVGNGGGPRCA
eukprot:361357-Chlamydomonas_euryale.AAC.1